MKSVTLKADTALLRALVESDPELKLQISAAVLKNISDDAVAIQVQERLQATLDEMSKTYAAWEHHRSAVLKNPWRSTAFHNLLKKMVSDQIAVATEELIIQSVTPVIKKVFDDMVPEFQMRIDAMIDASMSPEHLKKRLEAKLAALG